MKHRFLFLPLAAVLSVAAIFVACGDDDDDTPTASPSPNAEEAAQKQEIADFIRTMTATDGASATDDEVDFYMTHITDEFTQAFGGTTVEDCRANSEDCIGEPPTNPQVDTNTIEIDGDAATALVVTQEVGTFRLDVDIEGDDYKLAGIHVVDDEVPADAEAVDLTLSEFAFSFEDDSEAVKSGNFYFAVKNEGEQAHEVGLVKIPEDANVDELLEADDPSELGAEFLSFKLPYAAGDEADFAPPPLDDGRYLLVCFFSNTEEGYGGTPHAFLGMVRDFHVGDE